MKPVAPLLAIVLAACSSSAPTLTTAPPGPTSTTTIVNDTCERLAHDAADYLEVVIKVLNETSTDVFVDTSTWPEALVALEQQGGDLDTRATALRCDLAEMQAAIFTLADVDARSPLARYLSKLLGLG